MNSRRSQLPAPQPRALVRLAAVGTSAAVCTNAHAMPRLAAPTVFAEFRHPLPRLPAQLLLGLLGEPQRGAAPGAAEVRAGRRPEGRAL
eukprot:13518259-Alexandrium_andersonii.AAC.1